MYSQPRDNGERMGYTISYWKAMPKWHLIRCVHIEDVIDTFFVIY